MRYAFALLLLIVLGLIAVLPANVQAGPFIYRGGAWDRMAQSNYSNPGYWNYRNGYTGSYNYSPYYGNYYYQPGYNRYSYYYQPGIDWSNFFSQLHHNSPSRENPD
jgi:hypothetical protein